MRFCSNVPSIPQKKLSVKRTHRSVVGGAASLASPPTCSAYVRLQSSILSLQAPKLHMVGDDQGRTELPGLAGFRFSSRTATAPE